MKKDSVRFCKIIRASYVFVFYLFLGLLTSIVSFAQDYAPIRNNRGTDSGFHGRIVTKYGVSSPRIRIEDLEPKESKTDETKNEEKFGDPWKENEEVVDAYGVIVSEEDLKKDDRIFKERPRIRDNEVMPAYGVAIPTIEIEQENKKE